MPEKIDQINKLIKALPLPKKGLYKLKNSIDVEDFNILLQSKEGKIYTADGSSFSGGGGGSSFLPNGIKTITESRELQADDAGYFLVLIPEISETDVILTIPEISPIPVGGVFAVVNQMDESGKNNGIINTTTEGAVLKLGAGETLVYTVTNPNICIPISTIEVYDSGEYKTALRYLMDNVGALYPNGVEVVTATRDFQESDIGKFLFLAEGVGLTMPTSAPFYPNNKLIGIFAGSTNFPCDNFYEITPGKKVYLYGSGHSVQTSNESLTLITGSNFDNSQQTIAPVNGTPVFVNESDTVGYTATRYLMDKVANANSYSTDEKRTGGTWIDGKPIYRKYFEVNGNDTLNISIDLIPLGLNIDKGLPTSIFYVDDGASIRPLPISSSIESNIKTGLYSYDGGDSSIQFKSGTAGTLDSSWKFICILEYTKTTD